MLQPESRTEIRKNQVLINSHQLDQTIMVSHLRLSHSGPLEPVELLGVRLFINLIMQTHSSLQHEVLLHLTHEGRSIPKLRREKTFLVQL